MCGQKSHSGFEKGEINQTDKCKSKKEKSKEACMRVACQARVLLLASRQIVSALRIAFP